LAGGSSKGKGVHRYGLHHFQGLGPRTHNALHIRNPLFGHSFLGTYHQGQVHFQGFLTPFNFPVKGGCGAVQFQAGSQRYKGEVEQLGYHPADGRPIEIDGFLTGKNQIVSAFFGYMGNLAGNSKTVLTLEVHPNGFITTQRQCFTDNGIIIGCTNIYKMNYGRGIFFLQFDGSHQCIPLIIRVDDPLNPVRYKFRVVIGEGYFCRCIRRFTNTN
jgi:hypothetical protein